MENNFDVGCKQVDHIQLALSYVGFGSGFQPELLSFINLCEFGGGATLARLLGQFYQSSSLLVDSGTFFFLTAHFLSNRFSGASTSAALFYVPEFSLVMEELWRSLVSAQPKSDMGSSYASPNPENPGSGGFLQTQSVRLVSPS